MEDFSKIFQVISNQIIPFIIPICSVIVAMWLVKVMLKSNKIYKEGIQANYELKRWEVTLKYMDNYNEIRNKYSLVRSHKIEAIDYLKGYWYLQQEQFLLFEKNLINKEFYKMWIDSRIKEWNENSIFSGYNYQEGYNKIKEMGYLLDRFQEFVEKTIIKQIVTIKNFK